MPDKKSDQATHQLTITNEQAKLAINKEYFVVENGEPRVPTQEELDARQLARDKKTRENYRDELMCSAVIEYNGYYIDMSHESEAFMAHSYGAFERGRGANWKMQDKITGDKVRVNLKKQDIDKITDAVFDAKQIIHESADTQMPINPWPLLVE